MAPRAVRCWNQRCIIRAFVLGEDFGQFVGRVVIRAQAQAARRDADFAFDGDVRPCDGHCASRQCHDALVDGKHDIAVAVGECESPKPVLVQEIRREDHLLLAIRAQRRGAAETLERECIGGKQVAVRLENDGGRRWGTRINCGANPVLILERQHQRSRGRRVGVLAGACHRVAIKVAVERHGGHRDGEGTGRPTLNVARLVMRAAQERTGEGLRDIPARVRLGKPLIDAVVDKVGAGLSDVENVRTRNEPGCLNFTPLVVDPAARNVDPGAGLHDEGIARIDGHRTARDGELTHRVLDQIHIARNVGQRRADPRLPVKQTALPGIDFDGLAAQHSIALQGRVGQF